MADLECCCGYDGELASDGGVGGCRIGGWRWRAVRLRRRGGDREAGGSAGVGCSRARRVPSEEKIYGFRKRRNRNVCSFVFTK